MRTIFDAWGKLMWQPEVLEELRAQAEVEVASQTLRLDVWIRPRRRRLSRAARSWLGAASIIAATEACIELYTAAPDEAEVLRSLRKYMTLAEGRTDRVALWFLCASPSSELLHLLSARRIPEQLEGFYEGAGVGQLRVVVIPELPPLPETLFLRLLGRGDTLRQALAEVRARPASDPLHHVLTLLETFREDFERRGLIDPFVEEFAMITWQDVYERVRQREAELQQHEAERQQHEAERQQHEAERQQYEAERQQREAERQQHEAERQRLLEALEAERQRQLQAREADRQQGALQILAPLCTHKLSRPLSAAERRGLVLLLERVGVEALVARALESTPAELEAWLGQAVASEEGA